jgi:hypothetical protein
MGTIISIYTLYLIRERLLFAEDILVVDELPEGVLEDALPGILAQAAVRAQSIQTYRLSTVH